MKNVFIEYLDSLLIYRIWYKLCESGVDYYDVVNVDRLFLIDKLLIKFLEGRYFWIIWSNVVKL